jgi:hypothetical protein
LGRKSSDIIVPSPMMMTTAAMISDTNMIRPGTVIFGRLSGFFIREQI